MFQLIARVWIDMKHFVASLVWDPSWRKKEAGNVTKEGDWTRPSWARDAHEYRSYY
jgi:hypothetical protein